MTPPDPATPPHDTLPEAEAAPHRRWPSVVWLIPLVAGAIALWLGVTTLQQRGPLVTITFDSAEGLAAGKTRVRYKDVEVGTVTAVDLTDDLSRVRLEARMDAGIAEHLNEGTRFWVVRPRIGASGVSGLETLVSGAYVALDPGPGEPARAFEGLATPPPIRSDRPGTRFVLRTDELGGVGRGSPVLYRGILVGQVLDRRLAEDRESFVVPIFVDAPHDQLVRPDSRFWNAGGIDVDFGSDGLRVSLQSLEALVAGGVAFDTPGIGRPGEPAAADLAFPLYRDFESIGEAAFTETVSYTVLFEGSVRGLAVGAPVEFRGIRIGEVTSVRLVVDRQAERVRIPVEIALQPERVTVRGAAGEAGAADPEPFVAGLVERGLRAQLRIANLLTGEMLVSLDFYPDAPAATLATTDTRFPVLPSVPTDIEAITASVTAVLNKVAALPLEDLVADLQGAVASIEALAGAPATLEAVDSLNAAAASLESLLGAVEGEVGPLLAQAESTLEAADTMLGPRSEVRYSVTQLLDELTRAARSIRLFADYLERHPEALIRGRTGFQ